jgi:hypothetical protein
MNLFNQKNEIIPGLWIGDYHSAHDFDFLKNNDIKVVINCTVDIPYITDILDPDKLITLEPLELYRIPVYDSLQEIDFIKMEYYLEKIIPILFKVYIEENKHILIHCRAGKMRSGCVGLSFLYFLRNHAPNIPRFNHPRLSKILPIDLGYTEHEITSFMLKRRYQLFGYGLRNNFRLSFLRFFKLVDK